MNPEDFIDQVAQGFDQINKTKVGQLLLEEIAELNSNDLVIFNINFPILLNLQEDSNGAFKNQWLQKVPTQIRLLLGWDANFMSKNNITENRIHELLLECYSSCFLSQASSLFAKNLIFIGPEKFTNCLWDWSDATIRVTDEDIPIHLHLFHELNHYRHFKQNIGTYDSSGTAMGFRNGQLAIPISILSIPECQDWFSMHNIEEELQLTGFTVTKKQVPIYDRVNEVRYRIQCNLPIRYPYKISDDANLIKDKKYFVSPILPLAILIQSSYNGKKAIEGLTQDVLANVQRVE